MDFDAYAKTAVDLVNAPLEHLDDLRAVFIDERSWMREEAVERDVAVFRRAQRRLRDVFEAGAAGRDAEAVAELNILLETYPIQPRISGHDSGDWHMHVTSRGASVSAEYLAGAAWGLAVWLCEYGSARFGVCADERCATRSHVAAHRARKRAAVDEMIRQLAPVG